MSISYSLKQIALFLDAEVIGDDLTVITGLATLECAKSSDIAFLSNPKYAKQLEGCQAGAVILQSAQAQLFNGNCLVVADAYLSYAKISAWFDKAPVVEKTIHASASIDPTATVGDAVFIGPNVVIEADVQIGSGTVIKANTVIGARSVVGENCTIAANVSIYHDVRMGSDVRVHSGAVIGADGFGFASKGKDGWQKISQIGGVLIGDNVDTTEHKRILKAKEESLAKEELKNHLELLEKAQNAGDVSALRKVLQRAIAGFKPDKEIVDVVYLQKQN